MKYFFTFFCLCVLACTASAQVSKTTFVNTVNEFNIFENQRDSNMATDVFVALNGMIKNQIIYLDTKIIRVRNKYQVDSTRASDELRHAQSSSGPSSPQLTQARNYQKEVGEELDVIPEIQKQQNAYKSMLANLWPLQTNIVANKTAINTIYTSFLQTLP